MSKVDIGTLRRAISFATPPEWRFRVAEQAGSTLTWIEGPGSETVVFNVDGRDGELIAALVNSAGPLLDELEAARKVVEEAAMLVSFVRLHGGLVSTHLVNAIDAYDAVVNR